MPKIKTHSGTKSRVKITKTGKILRKQAFTNHFLQKKSASRKRRISGTKEISGKVIKQTKRRLGL